MTYNPSEKRDGKGQWTHLAGLLKSGGGFTHSLNTGEEPSKGFAVSIPGHEQTYEGHASAKDIKTYAQTHSADLAAPDAHLGAWFNEEDGKTYLDVSHVLADQKAAASTAIAHKQLAYFDLSTFEEHRVTTADKREVTNMADGDLEKERASVAKALESSAGSGAQKALKARHKDLTEEQRKRLLKKAESDTPGADLSREIVTPVAHSDFAKTANRLAFWKQILPMAEVEYTATNGTRRKANFDRAYLTDLANNKAVDTVGFLLADEKNSHTMDPERYRGRVSRMEVRSDGLYGLIEFPSPKAAAAVLMNPDLGVSARIREGISKSDGSTVSRGIIHVLGTLDPQVSGMSPWQAADLSNSDYEVLDLSNETFKESTMPKSIEDLTEADIDAMSEDEVDALMRELTGVTTAVVEPEVETEEVVTPEPALSLSNDHSDDIALANERAAAAGATAREALRRAADAEWKQTRTSYLEAGVPPHLLDLSESVLNRPDDMVIDLSNTAEDDVNVSAIVRGLLDAAKGTIDLSAEVGHNGTFGGEGDPDADMLDAWAKQS